MYYTNDFNIFETFEHFVFGYKNLIDNEPLYFLTHT